MNIPFHRPALGDSAEEELAQVAEVLRSGWLTTGPKAAQLEAEFASASGAPFAAAVSSCTAGLHVALAALGVGEGDEVITTPLTFCATVQAIELTGATPVLADVGCDGNIDPASIESRITSRTRAILPVRLAGLPCNIDSFRTLAQKHNLVLVEDAAHADPLCGATECDAAVYSFYATKNMTTAEGGMVTTRNEALDARIRLLAHHGIRRESPGHWKYQVVEPGFKYNLSDLQAAVGLAQIRRLPQTRKSLRSLANLYQTRFKRDAEDLIELPPGIDQPSHSCHLYSIRLRLDRIRIARDEFIDRLAERAVTASVHFIPIPLHPAFRHLSADPAQDLPRAMALYPRLISLPIYASLSEEQVAYVADSVIAIARGAAR